ncbi:MAG: DegT/DnrJ/EryC1/StrS family aminotransferase [bacterium]|nr:DegT/DnrJ/EryC1/StrS family aminotransferase [bacterium]
MDNTYPLRPIWENPHGKYSGRELEYVSQALDSEDIENKKNPWTKRFEQKFARLIGAEYAIAVNSGTSGLHAALIAAGVNPGDEVISPGITVIMDAVATIHVGATPVFADVNPHTQTIDPGDVQKKITSKTKAIITVSLQGLPVDIDPIMALASKYNITVIEDSAQTLLGKYKGKIAGSLGHIGVFSFENKKHLTTGGEGGMIVTNHRKLAEVARKFAGIGYKNLTPEASRMGLLPSEFQDPDYERFDSIGLNYRMTEMSAAIGMAQLERVHEIISRRQAIAKLFDEAIADCEWLVPQQTPKDYEHAYYTYAVEYSGHETIGLSWKDFYHKYKEMGGDGFYGACKVPYLEPVFHNLEINGHRFSKGLCPVAENLQPRLMQFKTNYRDMDVAAHKVKILKQLIKKFKS